MTIVPMTQPIDSPAGQIVEVVVRIPTAEQFEARPPQINDGIWNCSIATGLPVEAVLRLSPEDRDAVARAWGELAIQFIAATQISKNWLNRRRRGL